MAPAEVHIADIKARGNALFRDGDFQGAADAFQHAVRAVRQMPTPKSDAAGPGQELACLCNLAYAQIKLGSMHEAEEACSRALHIQPSCAKALFRRGQARLALGRALDAATDFRAVTALEPRNVEATKMLHRAQQKEESNANANERPPAEKPKSPASRVLVPAEEIYQQPRRSSLDERSNAELQSATQASPQLSAVEGEMTTCTNNKKGGCLGEGNTTTRPPPPVAISTTTHCSSSSGAPPPPENSSSSTSSSRCDVVNVPAEEEHEEESGKKSPHNSVEASSNSSPASASCFLVSGWLTSTEREQAREQQQQQQQQQQQHQQQQQKINEGKHVGMYHPPPHTTTKNDRAKVSKSAGGAKAGAVSVSRLVSQLSASQEASSKEQGPSSASGTTTTAAALAEWSILQAEEKRNVKESVRRWSPGEGLHHQDRSTEKAMATTTGVKGKATHQKRRNVPGPKKKKSAAKEMEQGRGAAEESRTTALWVALEEEENKVREAFRAKLGIGDKPSTKNKTQDRKKKKSTAACLRAEAA